MTEKSQHAVSLIIPVYNEKGLLEDTIDHCLDVLSEDFSKFELILVDDGSTDGTGELMDEIASTEAHITVLHNNINLNVGISVQRAMKVASNEFVVHNAVDFPLAVKDIRGLVEKMDEIDVLVLERSSYAGYTPWRWITSKVNRLFLKLFFDTGDIRDLNFTQIYRRDIVSSILPLAKSPSFTTPEMIFRAKRARLRVRGVSVDYKERPSGSGSFGKPHDIMWSLYDMLRYWLRKNK